MAGAANSWPFEFAGMEHEITDPANLYFLPGSNVYNPQLQIDLSQVGPQGLAGPGGGNLAGPAGKPPSGSSGGLTWQSYGNDLEQSYQAGGQAFLVGSEITIGEVPIGVVVGVATYVVDFMVNFFDDLFGGGGPPPIPRQLMHRRHPLYGQIIGINSGLIPTEASACKLCGDPHPCRKAPLQKPQYTRPQQPESTGNLDYFNSCNVFSLTASGGLCALLGGACVASIPGEPEDAPINVPACVIGGASCIGFLNDLGCCVKPHAGCDNPERDFTKVK